MAYPLKKDDIMDDLRRHVGCADSSRIYESICYNCCIPIPTGGQPQHMAAHILYHQLYNQETGQQPTDQQPTNADLACHYCQMSFASKEARDAHVNDTPLLHEPVVDTTRYVADIRWEGGMGHFTPITDDVVDDMKTQQTSDPVADTQQEVNPVDSDQPIADTTADQVSQLVSTKEQKNMKDAIRSKSDPIGFKGRTSRKGRGGIENDDGDDDHNRTGDGDDDGDGTDGDGGDGDNSMTVDRGNESTKRSARRNGGTVKDANERHQSLRDIFVPLELPIQQSDMDHYMLELKYDKAHEYFDREGRSYVGKTTGENILWCGICANVFDVTARTHNGRHKSYDSKVDQNTCHYCRLKLSNHAYDNHLDCLASDKHVAFVRKTYTKFKALPRQLGLVNFVPLVDHDDKGGTDGNQNETTHMLQSQSESQRKKSKSNATDGDVDNDDNEDDNGGDNDGNNTASYKSRAQTESSPHDKQPSGRHINTHAGRSNRFTNDLDASDQDIYDTNVPRLDVFKASGHGQSRLNNAQFSLHQTVTPAHTTKRSRGGNADSGIDTATITAPSANKHSRHRNQTQVDSPQDQSTLLRSRLVAYCYDMKRMYGQVERSTQSVTSATEQGEWLSYDLTLTCAVAEALCLLVENSFGADASCQMARVLGDRIDRAIAVLEDDSCFQTAPIDTTRFKFVVDIINVLRNDSPSRNQ